MDAMRPRGIGDFGISEVKKPEPVPVDGDDYTWDWHAAQSGDLGPVDLSGTMTGGDVQGLRYDVRTGPQRLAWEVSVALYALERQLALLQQRVAALERGARGEGRETR